MEPTLARRLDDALRAGDPEAVRGADAVDERDALIALLEIYNLWTAPLGSLDGRERLQNHPVVADLKWRLEEPFVAALDESVAGDAVHPADVCAAMRRVARADDGAAYEWLATSADWDQLVTFLTVEGGPDGGFDDLVAICQVGVRGVAKVVLGANYWDEMGRGEPADVHTVLHDRLVAAVGLKPIPREELPTAALRRTALNGLLATNRWLQPEMIGALGLTELQAGPRCRKVLQAFDRLGAPTDAYPFYEEHAVADPRHGKEWLDGAVVPLVEEDPSLGPRIVRGARWRAEVNQRLFAELVEALSAGERLTA